MEILIGIIAGIIIGASLTGAGSYVVVRRERETAKQAADAHREETIRLSHTIEQQQQEQTAWIAQRATLQAQLESAHATLQAAQEQAQKDARQRAEAMQTELQLARETMRTQFEQEMLQRTETLKHTNAEQMTQVVEPLRRELDLLRQLVNQSKESSDKNTASLAQSIRDVFEHDRERDKTTQALANALKNRGKVQGDWGEQILANILRDSGLREGEEYIVQTNVKDDTGRNLRPDIIVKGADGSRIIIDSKVSLSAYADYVGAESDEQRKAASKANYDSIWRHVEELSAKNYSAQVPNAVPLVLMFVPNEGAYILAMNYDARLGSKAYQKGVLIINPTNLMVVLRLILLTWQNTRQEKNYEAIRRAAQGIYEKYTTFADSYLLLGNQLNTARNTYEKGIGQLREGRGNLSARLEDLLRYGVTTTKSIPEDLQSLNNE